MGRSRFSIVVWPLLLLFGSLCGFCVLRLAGGDIIPRTVPLDVGSVKLPFHMIIVREIYCIFLDSQAWIVDKFLGKYTGSVQYCGNYGLSFC